jgi:hypothetical protein
MNSRIHTPSRPAARISLLGLAVCLLVSASPLAGQALAVAPGQRVRVTTASFRGVGLVAATGADSLTLILENYPKPVVYPWSGVSRLDVRRPLSKPQGALKGAKWGAIIGSPFMGLVAAAYSQDETRTKEDPSTALFAIVGIAEAAGIGAIVGAIHPGGAWDTVRSAPAISLRPAGGGIEVAMRIRR